MPVDFVTARLYTASASNTGQAYIGSWDTWVSPVAGTIAGAIANAQSLTSSGRVNSVDIYLQPSGVSGASNSATSVLVAPLSLASNNNAVSGLVRASNQRVAVGDLLQLRTDTGAAGSLGFTGLSATVLIKPD